MLLFEFTNDAQDQDVLLVIISRAPSHLWWGEQTLRIVETNRPAWHTREMCEIIDAYELWLYVALYQ